MTLVKLIHCYRFCLDEIGLRNFQSSSKKKFYLCQIFGGKVKKNFENISDVLSQSFKVFFVKTWKKIWEDGESPNPGINVG